MFGNDVIVRAPLDPHDCVKANKSNSLTFLWQGKVRPFRSCGVTPQILSTFVKFYWIWLSKTWGVRKMLVYTCWSHHMTFLRSVNQLFLLKMLLTFLKSIWNQRLFLSILHMQFKLKIVLSIGRLSVTHLLPVMHNARLPPLPRPVPAHTVAGWGACV